MTGGIEEDDNEDNDLVGAGPSSFWWEKTVEFLFARKFLKNTVMPLSGALERFAGDAFLKSADNFGIIEFKASIERAESERKKYREQGNVSIDSYTDYLPLIQARYSNGKIRGREPHVMIYGFEKEGKLDIGIIDYWRRLFDDQDVDLQIPMRCIAATDFEDYLSSLAALKEPPKRSKFRGGSVFGVSRGQIVSQIPLDFLIDSLGYFPRPKPEVGSTPRVGGNRGR